MYFNNGVQILGYHASLAQKEEIRMAKRKKAREFDLAAHVRGLA